MAKDDFKQGELGTRPWLKERITSNKDIIMTLLPSFLRGRGEEGCVVFVGKRKKKEREKKIRREITSR